MPDGGGTWKDVGSGLSSDNISPFTLLIERGAIYAGTYVGVYRSTDLGDHWTLGSEGLPSPSDVLSLVKGGDLLFAGTEYGVYVSSDQGSRWYADTVGLPKSPFGGNLPVGSFLLIDSTIYAGTADAVYRRRMDARGWESVNTGIPIQFLYHPRVNILVRDRTNIYAATDFCTGSVYASSNLGENWVLVSGGLPQGWAGCYQSVYSLAVWNGEVFAGGDFGIYRSTNAGRDWLDANAGLPRGPAQDLFVPSIASTSTNLFAGTFAGIFRLGRGDSIWRPVFTTYPGKVEVRALGATGGNLFVETYSHYWNGAIDGIYRSTDFGNRWSTDTSLMLGHVSSFLPIGR